MWCRKRKEKKIWERAFKIKGSLKRLLRFYKTHHALRNISKSEKEAILKRRRMEYILLTSHKPQKCEELFDRYLCKYL